MNKFEVFYYDNYDTNNVKNKLDDPRYVLSDDKLLNIVYELACQDEYYYDTDFFEEESITRLKSIDIIRSVNNKIAINCPIFLESDLKIIEAFLRDYTIKIVDKIIMSKEKIYTIISKVNNGFSVERNLFHIICGMIFDGLYFNYLEEANLVATSKIHKSGLDYLVILYEASDNMKKYSNNLLCSFNRYKIDNYVFSSFGDCNGNRIDFFRYFKMKKYNKLTNAYCNVDNLVNQIENIEKIGEKFNNFIRGEKIDPLSYNLLEELSYIKDGKVNVPVFRMDDMDETIKSISSIIKDNTLDFFVEMLQNIPNELTASKHNVEKKEIANELFHIVFGSINELLAAKGFVEKPIEIKNQGRYFKSFEIFKKI